jgi:urease accessory protein
MPPDPLLSIRLNFGRCPSDARRIGTYPYRPHAEEDCACSSAALWFRSTSQPLHEDHPINLPATTLEAPLASQPRARGAVRLESKPRDGQTVLAGLHQSGSLKLLFPRSPGPDLQAVLVNTAGGVTGGDRFSVAARAARKTTLTLTTQAAERGYKAQQGETAQIRNRLTVESGASLNWLPQETILFQNAALNRRLSVDLGRTARLLCCEALIFGRMAMGERITSAYLRDEIRITRAGAPLFLDSFTLSGDIAAHLSRPTVAAGARAIASMIYIAPDAEAHLPRVRMILGTSGGASLIGPDLLFARLLAADGYGLRQRLIPLLTRLAGAALPKPWMI